MKDIFVNIKNKTRQVSLNTEILGVAGENCQGNIVIDFDGDFIDGVCWLETKFGETKGYVVLEKNSTNKTYSIPIKSCLLTNAGEMNLQIRITQNKVVDETPIFKSNIFKLLILESINAVEEIPDKYPEWIDIVTAEVEELDSKVVKLDEDLQSEITNRQTADEILQGNIDKKVDKVAGKGLSTNDFTNDYKTQVDNNTTARHSHSNKALLDTYDQTNENIKDAVTKKHSHSNKEVLDETTASYTTEEKTKLAGLSNYDDTEIQADITALQNGKVDKEDGKGLSTNDFTTAEKTKLSGIEAGAEKNVQSDWSQTDTTADDYIKNKPNIPDGAKLYSSTGQNTDGAMTQKAVSDKFDKETFYLELSIADYTQEHSGTITVEQYGKLVSSSRPLIKIIDTSWNMEFFMTLQGSASASSLFAGFLSGQSFYMTFKRSLEGTMRWTYNRDVNKAEILSFVYPVGSIYLSVNKTSPASFIGGTWEELPTNSALWTTATSSGNAGTTIAAGLPNITAAYNYILSRNDSYSASGAGTANKNDTTTRAYKLGESYTFNLSSQLSFDASKSNSIYGKSSTVQPPAYRIYAWKRTE